MNDTLEDAWEKQRLRFRIRIRIPREANDMEKLAVDHSMIGRIERTDLQSC